MRRTPVPAAIAAMVIAGCGSSQAALSTGGKSPQRVAPAQKYLLKLARKHESDNEGPEKAVPGRAPTWSYHVALGGRGRRAALVSLRGNHVCWRFPRTTRGSRAAIHVGAHGRRGPVLVVFGAQFSTRGCIVVRPIVVNSIAAIPRYYYLSVSGRGGIARAQL